MKKASLEIAAEDVQTLQKTLRCPTSESREILRAQTILGFADNKSGFSPHTYTISHGKTTAVN